MMSGHGAKKIKIRRREHVLTPPPPSVLRPITSHFCLILSPLPHPSKLVSYVHQPSYRIQQYDWLGFYFQEIYFARTLA